MALRTHHGSNDKSGRALMMTGLTQLPSFPPMPPVPASFVGRDHEQAQGLSMLQQRGVIAISGGAGSGKTALVAAIVEASHVGAFRIELLAGLNDRVEAFLWQFARPLAHEAPAIWRALHQIEQARWSYPPIVRLQMILDAYAQRSSEMIVWIDRIEHAADPAAASLIEGLCDYVAHTHRTQLRLILEGRTIPYQLKLFAMAPLKGLLPEAIMTWAQQQAIPMNHDEAVHVYQQTDGLPQAVALLFGMLGNDFDRSAIERVVARPEIRRFVMYLLSTLTIEEQRLLTQLVISPEQHHIRSPNTLFELDALEDKQLVTVTPTLVRVHPLIKDFYHRYAPTT